MKFWTCERIIEVCPDCPDYRVGSSILCTRVTVGKDRDFRRITLEDMPFPAWCPLKDITLAEWDERVIKNKTVEEAGEP